MGTFVFCVKKTLTDSMDSTDIALEAPMENEPLGSMRRLILQEWSMSAGRLSEE